MSIGGDANADEVNRDVRKVIVLSHFPREPRFSSAEDVLRSRYHGCVDERDFAFRSAAELDHARRPTLGGRFRGLDLRQCGSSGTPDRQPRSAVRFDWDAGHQRRRGTRHVRRVADRALSPSGQPPYADHAARSRSRSLSRPACGLGPHQSPGCGGAGRRRPPRGWRWRRSARKSRRLATTLSPWSPCSAP